MPRRSQAREVVFQILYEDDLNSSRNPAHADDLLQRRLGEESLLEFAQLLVRGVRQNREKLDELIESAAENWSLGRMVVTDRNVLRLGTFELLYCDTPDRVVINEAIELAKRFGTAQSAKFVNGILDRLMHSRSTDDE